MRKITAITIIVSSLMLTNAFAGVDKEIRLKAGYLHTTCPYISDSPVAGVSIEARSKVLGLEVETQGFVTNIEDVNNLYCGSISLIPKLYIKDFYLGFKAGYIFTAIANGMDADDEVSRGAVMGYNLTKDWFIESQYNIADLDVETGLATPAPVEQHSRLNNWQILIGKRIKF